MASSSRGKFAVLFIFALALALASFAWWWNYNRGRQVLAFYGPEAAQLIRTAPKVEILNSEPTGNIDISKAHGLLNARASLLGDASYEWAATEPSFFTPRAAVRFSQDDRSVTIFFDFDNRSIQVSPNGLKATLTKKTAEGWKTYLERQARSTEP
jgi:hypothetical protein